MQLTLTSRVFSTKVGARSQARRSVTVQAASRPLWQPGSIPPAHLDGSLPGDYGFDPLNLGTDKKALDWYRNAELQNGRWAMLGVAGMLIPDITGRIGVMKIPAWWANDEVLAQRGIPFNSLLMTMFFLFNFVELKRWEDMKTPGSQAEPGSFIGLETSFKGTGVSGYPGGPFDPLNLTTDDTKLKEIKNARLAMVAFLGFVCQHAATGQSPIDNLVAHIRDPWAVNFCTNGVSLPVSIF